MDTARSWLSDSSFADATTMEGEKISCSMENALAQTIHMGRHKVRAPLGPGTVENAKHACSIINAAVRAEVMVACSDGGSRRLIGEYASPRTQVGCALRLTMGQYRLSPVTVSKPCKDTFCGLHHHSYEYGTVVERVDPGGLAEAAGLACKFCLFKIWTPQQSSKCLSGSSVAPSQALAIPTGPGSSSTNAALWKRLLAAA